MNDIIKTTGISFVLLITDTIICLIITLFYGAFQEYYLKKNYGIKSYTEGALFSGIIRFIYCFVISMALFYMFNRILKLHNKILKLVIINSISYLIISLLYGFILKHGFKIIFIDWNPIYYIILISTILSPLTLNKILILKN